MGAELWEIELAWATTVHKAQGSESKAVIVVLSPQHRPLLTRRLFYTGAGRGPCPALLHDCLTAPCVRASCFMLRSHVCHVRCIQCWIYDDTGQSSQVC